MSGDASSPSPGVPDVLREEVLLPRKTRRGRGLSSSSMISSPPTPPPQLFEWGVAMRVTIGVVAVLRGVVMAVAVIIDNIHRSRGDPAWIEREHEETVSVELDTCPVGDWDGIIVLWAHWQST